MSYIEPPFDSNPDDIIGAILDAIAAAVPGWRAEEGHLEVALAEAIGRINAETRDLAARMLTSAFRFYGRSLVGLPPIDAVAATATTTWAAIDNAGYTIQAGTNVGYRLSGDVTLPFQVVSDVVIPPGSTTTTAGAVTIQAITPGTAANGLPSGDLVLVDSLAFVASITATADTAGGVDAESDSAYLTRLRSYLTLLTPRPILPNDFALLTQTTVAGVHRATAINLYSPPRTITDGDITSGSNVLTSPAQAQFTADDVGRAVTGAGIPGGTTITAFTSVTAVVMSANASATGAGRTAVLGARTNLERAVTIAAVDADGAAVSAGVKTTIQTYLDSLREVGFKVGTVDPTYTVVNVAFQFTTMPGYDPFAVRTAAEAAATAFIDPAVWNGGALAPPTWDSSETSVRILEMASVLYRVTGLRDVTSLTLNGVAADVALTGIAPLPQPGTVVGTQV